MNLHTLLERPKIYALKTAILSLGRHNVRDFLLELSEQRKNENILDVACGAGQHADIFSDASRYVGIDLNPSYMEFAAAEIERPFFTMDATNLALESETFDLTYAVGLFHHLSDEEVLDAASEMARVTNVGGASIIVDAVRPGPFNVFGQILYRLDRGDHVRHVPELQHLLSGAGFKLLLPNLPRSFPYRRAVFILNK